ncbi:MAG: T6SS effector amidase Tae4 family protein [Candidatus Thiodiazotropha sp.]
MLYPFRHLGRFRPRQQVLVTQWSKTSVTCSRFATWLKISPPSGFGKCETISSADFQSKLNDRTGVVFFKDYWLRGNESQANRSGDHIDLWNRSRTTSSSKLWRGIIEIFGVFSDLNASKSIWFWEVN